MNPLRARLVSPWRLSKQWPLIKRLLVLGLLIVVVSLLIRQARNIDWDQVATALAAYQASTLIIGAAFTVLTYAVYGSFDILGKFYIRSPIGSSRMMSVAFVSYAFNQNFGAFIGTIGLRLRLYSRLGLSNSNISRLILLSIVTNWLGYGVIAGGLFSFELIKVPAGWSVGQSMLRVCGISMLCLAAGYLYACARAARRELIIFGRRFELPSLELAITQLSLSATHWLATASILYVLTHGRIPFINILGTYMLTSIAAVIAHLPAGLGILEGIFLTLLGKRMPAAELLAALLTFRALFYLGALIVAGVVYVLLEANMKNMKRAASRRTQSQSHLG